MAHVLQVAEPHERGSKRAFPDFATWLGWFYYSQCNPESGQNYGQGWMPDAVVLCNPATGMTTIRGTLMNKETSIGYIVGMQNAPAAGCCITESDSFPSDVDQIWPSMLAYQEYCMHRVGGPLTGSWELIAEPTATYLLIKATIWVKVGSIWETRTSIFDIYYDPTSCMFSCGTGGNSYFTINGAITAAMKS